MKNQREKMKHFEFFFSDIMCENIWADPHFSHIGEKIEETVTNLVTVKKISIYITAAVMKSFKYDF